MQKRSVRTHGKQLCGWTLGSFKCFLTALMPYKCQQRDPRKCRTALVRLPRFPKDPPDSWWTLQTCWVSYLGCRLLTSRENAQVCSRKLNPGSRHITCISATQRWDGQPRVWACCSLSGVPRHTPQKHCGEESASWPS